jgi:7-carboxy-7-deazaguanine synthase
MSCEMLTVNEIFHSIQGESSWAGLPCVFVRLTACDLRCSWCDTPYAFTEGRKRSVDDVLAEVERHGCPLVEITGGEPLLQADVYPLMEALQGLGRTVLLETGGHVSLERVPPGVVIVMDVKCPGSGEAGRTEWRNIERLGQRDEVKFVVKDRPDYEFARAVVAERGLTGRVGSILFSPVHGVLDPRQLSAWILEDRLPVRLQIQVHKYIWGAATRGV